MFANDIATKIPFDASPLFTALLPVCFILMVAGLITNLTKEGRSPVSAVVAASLLVFGLFSFSSVVQTLQDYMVYLVSVVLEVDPFQVILDYVEQTKIAGGEAEGGWFLGSIFKIVTNPAEGIIIAFFLLVALVASVIMTLAFVFQHYLLSCALAVSPIFFGFLAIPATRSVAVHFFLSVAGVISWPLSWGIASIFTKAITQLMSDGAFFPALDQPAGQLFLMGHLLGAFVVGIWIILSTLLGPIVCQKLVSTGVSSAGDALVQVIKEGGKLVAGA